MNYYTKKSEETEQEHFMTWVDRESKYNRKLWGAFHIANERKCSQAQGAKFKRLGVKAGVPDNFFPFPSGVYHGLWIELKYGTNRASAEQKAFLKEMIARGYYACICYSKESAVEIVQRYMGLIGTECLIVTNELLSGTGITVKFDADGIPTLK